jgi:hypothetical protein
MDDKVSAATPNRSINLLRFPRVRRNPREILSAFVVALAYERHHEVTIFSQRRAVGVFSQSALSSRHFLHWSGRK